MGKCEIIDIDYKGHKVNLAEYGEYEEYRNKKGVGNDLGEEQSEPGAET